MAKKIKYQDLLEIIEKETGFNKTKSDTFVKQFIDIIAEGLKRDSRVRISKFGTLKLRHLDERQGINPQTKEAITIPEHTKVVFKGARYLQEKVNHRYNLLQSQPIVENQKNEKSKKEEPVTKSDSERENMLDQLSEFKEIPKEESAKKQKDITPTGVRIAPAKPVEEKEAPEKSKKEETPKVVEQKPKTEKKPEPLKEESTKPGKVDFEKGAPFESEAVQVVIEKNTEPEKKIESFEKEEKKKSKLGYILAAALFVILFLVFIFWPASEEPDEPIAEAPVVDEQVKAKETPKVEDQVKAKEIPKPIVKLKKPGTPGGEHLVKIGDKLWGLSDNFYKDSYLWPNIYRMNYTEIPNPDILKINNTVIVPSLEGTHLKLSARDSVDISLGFYHAYEAYKSNGNEWAKYYLWVCKKYDAKTFREKQNEVDEEDLQFVLKRK